MDRKRLIKWLIIALIAIACAFGIFELVVYVLMGSEMKSRDDWNIQVGEQMFTSEERGVSLYEAPCEASITVSRMLPNEYEEEGFTYYGEAVQQRLGQQLLEMTQAERYTMEAPLAILDPFGTGSNGLLLSFDTDRKCQIRYTVHTTSADLPDFTAVAAEAGGEAYRRTHCFLLVGLVPGESNEVTLEAVGERGKVQQSVTFTIDMPASTSGYSSVLEHTDGESTVPLSNGLYYATGLGDYYGYTFFFDNNGVLRYEMVLEGFHSDRFLYTDHGLYTCVSSRKIALITPLGQAMQVYDLGQYELTGALTVRSWPW